MYLLSKVTLICTNSLKNVLKCNLKILKRRRQVQTQFVNFLPPLRLLLNVRLGDDLSSNLRDTFSFLAVLLTILFKYYYVWVGINQRPLTNTSVRYLAQ